MKRALALLVLAPLLVISLGWDALGRALGRRDLDPAIISASLQIGTEPMVALKPESVPALSDWLDHHAGGWGKVLYTPPLCERWIRLVYQDEKTVSLAIFPGVVIAHRGEKSGLLRKRVPAAEIDKLLTLFR